MRHRHRWSLQRSLTDSEAAGSAPHPSAPHALGPEHARREHRFRHVRCTACGRSVFLGGGDAERARIRLVGRSETAGCNWRRDSWKEVFPRICAYPPFSTFREKGVRKLFLGNRLRTAPPCFASSLEEQAHGIEAVPARAGQHRRLPLCTSGLCGLSRIAHAHARKPNDSRRRSSTPIARICIHELNRFLSGGSCLHDTDDL